MKKSRLLLFIIMILFPLIIKAKENIYISSAELYENNGVEEVEKVKFDNLNLNTNLKFNKVNTYIVYKLTLLNNDNDDYEVDSSSFESDSDYIEYTYNCETENNIIKAKDSTICYLKIKYKEAVSLITLESNNAKEEKTLTLKLSSDEIDNPKTSDSNIRYVFFIVLIISIIALGIIKKKKMIVTIIIIGIILVPTVSKALKTITLNLNSNVEITGNSIKCSHEPTNLREHIMCILETDISNIAQIYKKNRLATIETLRNDLKNGTRTFENISNNSVVNSIDSSIDYNQLTEESLTKMYNEINNLPEMNLEEALDFYKNYDESKYTDEEKQYYELLTMSIFVKEGFIPLLDWDDTFNKAPTKETYKNYPEGIYLGNYRHIPIIRKVNEENLRGYSFTKMTPQDNISEITDIKDIINTSVMINGDNKDVKIDLLSGLKMTKTIDQYGEVERVNIKGSLNITLSKDGNGNVIIKDLSMNPESISQTLLHRRLGIVNDMIDVYINLARMKRYSEDIYYNQDGANLMEQLVSRYCQIINGMTGIRKRNWYLNNPLDYRTSEFIKFTGIDFSGEKYFEEYAKKYIGNNDYTEEEKEEAYLEAERLYYEHYGLEPHLRVDTYNGNEYKYYEVDENNDVDLSRCNIIFDGKFYEGENGLFEFIADYLNIDVTNTKDIKESIFDILINK